MRPKIINVENFFENKYKSIKTHLLKYGNTVATKDIDEIVKRLKQDGIEVNVVQCCESVVVNGASRKIKDDIFYILEKQ